MLISVYGLPLPLRCFSERELQILAVLKVVELKSLEIAQQDLSRQVDILQPREVVECLGLCLLQITASALLFD